MSSSSAQKREEAEAAANAHNDALDRDAGLPAYSLQNQHASSSAHASYSGNVLSHEELAALFSITPLVQPVDLEASLSKPVALPQTSTTLDSTFTKAWPGRLAQYRITVEQWSELLDGLSCVMAASPPVQVFDVCGTVLTPVPNNWWKNASLVPSQSQAGNFRLITKSATDIYLARANQEYFSPRGLRIRVMRTEGLRGYLEIQANSKISSAKTMSRTFGRGTAKGIEAIYNRIPLPIVRPIANGILDAVKAAPDRIAGRHRMNHSQKQLDRWSSQISDLSIEEMSTSAVSANPQKGAVISKLQGIEAGNTAKIAGLQQDLIRVANKELSPDDYWRLHANAEIRPHARSADTDGHGSRLKKRISKDAEADTYDEEVGLWLVVYPSQYDQFLSGTDEVDSQTPLTVSDADFAAVLKAEAKEYYARHTAGMTKREARRERRDLGTAAQAQ